MRTETREQQWVLLHNDSQDAFHIETVEEYRAKPNNGYRLVGTYRSHEQAAWACRTLRNNRKLMVYR